MPLLASMRARVVPHAPLPMTPTETIQKFSLPLCNLWISFLSCSGESFRSEPREQAVTELLAHLKRKDRSSFLSPDQEEALAIVAQAVTREKIWFLPLFRTHSEPKRLRVFCRTAMLAFGFWLIDLIDNWL